MAKTTKKKTVAAAKVTKKPAGKTKKVAAKKVVAKKVVAKKVSAKKAAASRVAIDSVPSDAVVLDRLFAVVESRRDADPAISHSARLLSRGPAKVAQKFGEEAVECLIEAVAGNREALIGESADVLYHLLVLWVSSGVNPADVWAELMRREGVSGIAEKAARATPVAVRRRLGTSKIP
jgi:phosphoribosyl-ATP pyrophosphohydrolase